MLNPTAAIAAAERIKAQTGARVHRLGEPDELTEEAMPRKASTEPKVDPAPVPKKRDRKPGTKNAKAPRKSSSGAVFAVDSTGAIAIRRGADAMELSPGEAEQFVGFLRKIGVKV